MNKRPIATLSVLLIVLLAQGYAGQNQPEATQAQKPAPRPAPRQTLMDLVRRHMERLGSTIDTARSKPNMLVSTYADAKGSKTKIVVLNNAEKKLLGFYIYNFGNLKDAANREEVYKYLLATNDQITIGSFFVDDAGDIGYKYLVSTQPAFNAMAFEQIYLGMAAVARERGPEIRKLLNATENKPDSDTDQ